jgi:RimJ/RimL family protein N-acetyltransferase
MGYYTPIPFNWLDMENLRPKLGPIGLQESQPAECYQDFRGYAYSFIDADGEVHACVGIRHDHTTWAFFSPEAKRHPTGILKYCRHWWAWMFDNIPGLAPLYTSVMLGFEPSERLVRAFGFVYLMQHAGYGIYVCNGTGHRRMAWPRQR